MVKKDFSNMSNPADEFLGEMTSVTTSQEKETTNHKAKTSFMSSESLSQHSSFILNPS